MSPTIIDEKGLFWWGDEPVPDGQIAPASSIAGTLKVEADGVISVEMDLQMSRGGPFEALSSPYLPAGTEIHGLLKSSNRTVLLMGLYHGPSRFASRGISYDCYGAERCLVGGAPPIEIKRPMTASRLVLELDGLDAWLRLGNIRTKRSTASCSSRYRAPRDRHYQLPEGTITIEFHLSGPFPGKSRTGELRLRESASAVYTPTECVSLEAMEEQYLHFCDLFVLLTGSAYRLMWPRIVFDRDSHAYQLFFRRTVGPAELPKATECWTNFPQLRGRFGKVFQRYREMREELGPGVFLYIGTKRASELYVEHRFISLVTGLEALHRRRNPGEHAGITTKFARILSQIQKSSDRAWLRNQLKRSLEPGLGERLSENLGVLPLERVALRAFCQACADRRNDISHYGGEKTPEVDYSAFVRELALKAEALSYLYHIILLREIGIDWDTLERWLRSYKVRSALDRAGIVLGLKPDEAAAAEQSPN